MCTIQYFKKLANIIKERNDHSKYDIIENDRSLEVYIKNADEYIKIIYGSELKFVYKFFVKEISCKLLEESYDKIINYLNDLYDGANKYNDLLHEITNVIDNEYPNLSYIIDPNSNILFIRNGILDNGNIVTISLQYKYSIADDKFNAITSIRSGLNPEIMMYVNSYNIDDIFEDIEFLL